MSDVRRGRPPIRYVLRRVRLLGFHNFVDETVEVRDGGHLFLLGDNGSGKTTVLDAIHLVLTGAMGIELNAATRVGAAKDRGRTLQGIVLRYDTERGVMNEGGSIAYAVLELAEASGDGSLLAGIGIEATTMDADVTRWGFLARGPLESLPLVMQSEDGKRPIPREGLRGALPKSDFFGRMSEYRRAVAERLFGGPALYTEVDRFWSMAKAYREIVARSRDFAGLFGRLLPSPDRETFTEILRSVKSLDELEDTLGQLDAQRTYVSELAALLATVGELREAMARYRWLAVRRRLEAAVVEQTALEASCREAERSCSAAKAQVEAARTRVEEAESGVRSALASDPEGLAERLAVAEGRLRGLEAELRRLRTASLERHEQRAAALRDALAAATSCGRALLAGVVVAEQLAAELASMEQPLSAISAFLAGESRRAEDARFDLLPPVDPGASREITGLLSVLERSRLEAERTHLRCEAAVLGRRAEVEALVSRREEVPAVAGFAAAREALAALGIDAVPLFEALEPKPSAAPAHLLAVEELLGDASLAAFVVKPGDRARARAVVAAHPGARLVVSPVDGAALPDWVGALFAAKTDPYVLAAVATILAQHVGLGAVVPPDELGDLEHRGLAIRSHGAAPRLVGEAARRAAHAQRLAEARGVLSQAEAELFRGAEALAGAATRTGRARALQTAIDALRGQDVVEAHALVRASHAARERAERDAIDTDELRDEKAREVEAAASVLDALSARARSAGLEELQRRLTELRALETRARAGEAASMAQLAEASASLGALRGVSEENARVRAHLLTSLATLAAALRQRLPEELVSASDDELEAYVRVTQRGDQFKSVESIEERLRSVEREEAVATAEVGGDGSRGVRCLSWASRFAFGFWPEDLRVEDRRGQPLANVLAQIDRTIGEQREVVNEKTRELMDRLVMGALATELQGHVERLYQTVRSMNDLLGPMRFGTTRYQFKVTPRPERAELVTLIRQVSYLHEESRVAFRQFVDDRLDELKKLGDTDEIPELLDYRQWFDYRLSMRSTRDGETDLTRELRALGSGGEQGVPNYLLVLALARLMFDNADARIRPVLFDEAFYGIEAGRRDELLRFATELGLQLVVASPDQDGVTPSVKRTTTLFLVKDAECDVHLAPYHYWNDSHVVQRSLLEATGGEADPAAAVCAVGPVDP